MRSTDKTFTLIFIAWTFWMLFIVGVISAIMYAGFRTLQHFGIF